jgi:hypothetical protein
MFLISPLPHGFKEIYLLLVFIIVFLPIWCFVDIIKSQNNDFQVKFLWVVVLTRPGRFVPKTAAHASMNRRFAI